MVASIGQCNIQALTIERRKSPVLSGHILDPISTLRTECPISPIADVQPGERAFISQVLVMATFGQSSHSDWLDDFGHVRLTAVRQSDQVLTILWLFSNCRQVKSHNLVANIVRRCEALANWTESIVECQPLPDRFQSKAIVRCGRRAVHIC